MLAQGLPSGGKETVNGFWKNGNLYYVLAKHLT